jgi:hypothetical protein
VKVRRPILAKLFPQVRGAPNINQSIGGRKELIDPRGLGDPFRILFNPWIKISFQNHTQISHTADDEKL